MISSDEYSEIEVDPASSQHTVQFYESDDFLAERISVFIGSGLRADESCIIIATQAHREQIEHRLQTTGARVTIARKQRRYIALDAAEVMARFMVDGMPDADRFNTVIGGLIAEAAHSRPSRPICIFGEMVALLWDEGNGDGAVALEDLWNDFINGLPHISLCCAYSMRGFAGEAHKEPFSAICERHTHVLPAESFAALATLAERERAITLLQQRASSLEAEIAERKQVEERLRAMEARKDIFIGMASHELKTPVTSLKAFTQILQRRMRRRGDAETLVLLDRMEAQLEKLTGLVGDLLDVTKMQTGVLPFRESRFDFDMMVRETVADVQAVAITHMLSVRGATGAQVEGDRDRLAQVLTNLLTNAIKYSPGAERVLVRLSANAEPDSPSVEVAVRDYGLGIAEQHHTRIFERFYQVSDEQGSTYPGLGIGLYIAREFVERHGGRLWLESHEGEGSTFHVVLPCVRRDTDHPVASTPEESSL
jgi:signal transduction histidine kinase